MNHPIGLPALQLHLFLPIYSIIYFDYFSRSIRLSFPSSFLSTHHVFRSLPYLYRPIVPPTFLLSLLLVPSSSAVFIKDPIMILFSSLPSYIPCFLFCSLYFFFFLIYSIVLSAFTSSFSFPFLYYFVFTLAYLPTCLLPFRLFLLLFLYQIPFLFSVFFNITTRFLSLQNPPFS